MWTTSEMTVANNANGRINAFVRGMYESADGEVLVLINQNGGPGITPQNSGEVWQMVDANTTGLEPIGNVTVTPTPTATATATPYGSRPRRSPRQRPPASTRRSTSRPRTSRSASRRSPCRPGRWSR